MLMLLFISFTYEKVVVLIMIKIVDYLNCHMAGLPYGNKSIVYGLPYGLPYKSIVPISIFLFPYLYTYPILKV